MHFFLPQVIRLKTFTVNTHGVQNAGFRVQTVFTVYDALGERVAKFSGTTLTNVYLYDLDGRVVTELDGNFNGLRLSFYALMRHITHCMK